MAAAAGGEESAAAAVRSSMVEVSTSNLRAMARMRDGAVRLRTGGVAGVDAACCGLGWCWEVEASCARMVVRDAKAGKVT
jgi:hypothetical protein